MSQVEVSGRAADGGPRQHRHSTHRRRRGHAPLRTAVADAVGRSGSGESQTWHESVQHAAAQHLRGGPAGRCRGAAPTLRNGGGVLGEASYSKCGAVHQRESTVAAATVVVAAGAPLLVTTPTSAAAAAAAFAYLPTATAVRRVAARSRRGRLSSPALPLPSGILSSAVPLHGLRQWRSFETPGLQQLRSFEKPGLLRVLRVRKPGPKIAGSAARAGLSDDWIDSSQMQLANMLPIINVGNTTIVARESPLHMSVKRRKMISFSFCVQRSRQIRILSLLRISLRWIPCFLLFL